MGSAWRETRASLDTEPEPVRAVPVLSVASVARCPVAVAYTEILLKHAALYSTYTVGVWLCAPLLLREKRAGCASCADEPSLHWPCDCAGGFSSSVVVREIERRVGPAALAARGHPAAAHLQRVQARVGEEGLGVRKRPEHEGDRDCGGVMGKADGAQPKEAGLGA